MPHKIRIFPKTGTAALSKNWKVEPAKEHVSKGHKVTWSSRTRVRMWFPEKRLFGRTYLSISAKGKKTLTVKTNSEGHYKYVIYCGDLKCFAHGSEPEMIVP